MGSEVALTLGSMLGKTDIVAERYLFDGGPFFHFSKLIRYIMQKKFKSLVHKAQHGTEEEIIDKFSQN